MPAIHCAGGQAFWQCSEDFPRSENTALLNWSCEKTYAIDSDHLAGDSRPHGQSEEFDTCWVIGKSSKFFGFLCSRVLWRRSRCIASLPPRENVSKPP